MKLRPNEIEISKEEPFANDLLNREDCAKILTQIVQHTEGGFTLSINADWGYGKTTFVKMWQAMLQKEGYKTIHFNAWESDFVADPMMALVDGLRDGFEGKNFSAETKQILSAILDVITDLIQLLPTPHAQLIGKGTKAAKKGVCSLLKDKNSLQRQQSYSKLVAEFREQLSHFAKEMCDNKQLIIFVDELDRCRPDYAVQMLERIKHFFAIENVIFVLSIDKTVLCKSIVATYGGLDIDAAAYLRRFIDLEFALPEPNIKEYIDAHCEQKQIAKYFKGYDDYLRQANYHEDTEYTLRNALILCFQSEKRSLRDVEKYFNRLLILLQSVHFPHANLDLAAFMLFSYMFNKPLYETFKQMKISIPELWSELDSMQNSLVWDHNSNEYNGYLAMLIASLAFYIREKEFKNQGRDPIYKEIRGDAHMDWFLEDDRLQKWLKQEVINTSSLDMKTLCKNMELLTIMFKEEPEGKQEIQKP